MTHHDHSHAASGNAAATGAHAHDSDTGTGDPREFWEQRYADAEAVWSGQVNGTLADVVSEWAPGRSLDLGCGEGGDVLWLAERGWEATGIDLSATAVARARAAAAGRGIDARFVVADLGEWAQATVAADETYDLVTASFLQSPVELPRGRILRAALARARPGGRLVVISHAAPPAWARDHPGDFPSPEEELALLDLDASMFKVEEAQVRRREVRAPDGAEAVLDDTVVVVRRLP